MKDTNYRIVIGIIACGFFAVLVYFQPPKPVELDRSLSPVMGTFARIVVVAKNQEIAKTAIDAAFVEIEEVDRLMSDYKDDSQISKINRDAFKQPVNIGPPTFEVIQKSIEFSKVSDGAFDITVGPLVDLWRAAGESNSVPTKAELAAARAKVGYEKLIIDPNQMTVRFRVEGMRLDLGAIAKGYAVDKATAALQEAGAAGAMVDIGGDIRCFGIPVGRKKRWVVGLEDPSKAVPGLADRQVLLKLRIANAAVATSGDYRQFVLIDDKRHSHILNRTTGAGAAELASVTIITPNATDADALATAVTVLGAERGLALIEKLPDTEAILIPSRAKQKLVETSGADKYMQGR
jgi:thiamine biosynthesis lipoprotein